MAGDDNSETFHMHESSSHNHETVLKIMRFKKEHEVFIWFLVSKLSIASPARIFSANTRASGIKVVNFVLHLMWACILYLNFLLPNIRVLEI